MRSVFYFFQWNVQLERTVNWEKDETKETKASIANRAIVYSNVISIYNHQMDTGSIVINFHSLSLSLPFTRLQDQFIESVCHSSKTRTHIQLQLYSHSRYIRIQKCYVHCATGPTNCANIQIHSNCNCFDFSNSLINSN